MKQTTEKIWMTTTFILMLVFLGATLTSCSSDDENTDTFVTNEQFYAVITEPDVTPGNITPDDYVLTLNDIVAYNSKTGAMKIKGGEKIEEKSYPFPIQYRIHFYLGDDLLFSARLNNLLSSLMGGFGLVLYYEINGESGYSYLKLTQNKVLDEKGNIIEGELTDQEKQGLNVFENVMKNAGKLTKKEITWE